MSLVGLQEALEGGLHLVAGESCIGYHVAHRAPSPQGPKGFEDVGLGFCYGDAGQVRLVEDPSNRLTYTTRQDGGSFPGIPGGLMGSPRQLPV